MKVLNYKTNKLNTSPDVSKLEHGEIAVNYAKKGETLFIKNDGNEIAEFKDKKYWDGIIDDVKNDFEGSLTTTNERIDAIEQNIEENEEVVAIALTNLNSRTEILENIVVNSSNFGTYETMNDFNNANVTYPHVAYIVSENKIVYYRDEVEYNAVVELTTIAQNLLTEIKTLIGFYPMAFVDYMEKFEVDGVDLLSTAVEVVLEGKTCKVVPYPEEVVGIKYNVSFKYKTTPQILYDGNKDEVVDNLGFMTPFYGNLSKLVIDEDVYNRIIIDGVPTMMIPMYASTCQNFEVIFKGDFHSDHMMSTFYGTNIIYTIIYANIVSSDSDPDNQYEVNFKIPEGNLTYGKPTDIGDDTVFGAINQLIQLVVENNSNLKITVEIY